MTIFDSAPQHVDSARFEGVFALLLTPFQADGSIDWTSFDQYVDWQLSQQPHGLFVVCGSGEMQRLSLEERLAQAARTMQRAGDVPVVATANLEADPRFHAEEAKRMADTGVSGVVLVPPGDHASGPEQQAYFAELADQVPCPVLLYEWPGVTPYEIQPETYRSLVREHGVYGIKDTTCTLAGIQAKIQAAPESVVYQANTPFLLDAIEMGARGVMAITSTVATDLLVALWNSTQHDPAEAVLHHRQLVMLDAVLRFGYPSVAKYLLQLRGLAFDLGCRGKNEPPPEAFKAMEVWWQGNGPVEP